MKDYIENLKIRGAIREITEQINNIPFVVETTAIEDYPEKRSYVKIPQGKEVIYLAKAIIELVEDFYKEDIKK